MIDQSNNLREIPRYGGIYRIYNTLNQKSYIGIATNLRDGIRAYVRQLETGCFRIREMQFEYDKYRDFFEYEILEVIPKYDKRIPAKGRYIIKYDSVEKGYNTSYVRTE